MIITASPLRISLGGGGTDLPSYYENYTGHLIAAAINKYVYITIHQTFYRELILKYSQLERVEQIKDIQHPIIRSCMQFLDLPAFGLEITSMADIPSGTGLGSSGSFTTALLKGLHVLKRGLVLPEELAEQACHIELNMLKSPIGKQDQYIAAYGGLTCFTFLPGGKVQAMPLKISQETLDDLEDNLLLFFTGYSRNANDILQVQDQKSKVMDSEMLDNLHYTKEMGLCSQKALETGDLELFAKIMNDHWERKKKRAKNMSNSEIDQWYDLGMKNGAMGGKLIGAGGGGFLMFYTQERAKLRQAMKGAGLKEVRFNFDFEGTRTIIAN